jgi:peptide/nickel transport system ATP-binding protein
VDSIRETVLNIERLSVSFGDTRAVREVSFSLGKGELLALVGESGSGKTALCRAVMGLSHPDAAVSYERLDAPDASEMSLVLQDPMSSLDPTTKVSVQIEEAVSGRASRHEKRERALELLYGVGIDDPELRARQYPSFLSGGMRQRAAIAIALAMKPRVIFADEPTTALDAPLRSRIMGLLDKARAESGASVLFVTHDLNLVKNHADRLLIMKGGQIVESGTPSDIFDSPREPYTKELIKYANYGAEAGHYHGKIHYHGGKAHSHPGGEGHVHDADPVRADADADAVFPIIGHGSGGDNNTGDAPALVDVREVSKYYETGRRNVRRVFDNLNFKIYEGETLGVCGPSGVGKSTLARCLAGIEKVSGGEIGVPDSLKSTGSIQFVFQDSVGAFDPRVKIGDSIAEPIALAEGRRPANERVFELMSSVGLDTELARRYPGEISGGQRQRAGIARAIATNPKFLIADEPVSSLDVTTCVKILHLLKSIQQERRLTLLLISHDLPLLMHVSDRILYMRTD